MFSAERKAVYIKDGAGTLTDAATGQPTPAKRRPILTTCASTIGCGARSTPRSAD